MNYTFAVITKVPKVREGNEYDELLVQGYDKDNEVVYHLPEEGVEYRMVDTKFINARLPVFHQGEILILDESGREIGGLQRKPSKWSVVIEVFDNLDEAITIAQKTIRDSLLEHL